MILLARAVLRATGLVLRSTAEEIYLAGRGAESCSARLSAGGSRRQPESPLRERVAPAPKRARFSHVGPVRSGSTDSGSSRERRRVRCRTRRATPYLRLDAADSVVAFSARCAEPHGAASDGEGLRHRAARARVLRPADRLHGGSSVRCPTCSAALSPLSGGGGPASVPATTAARRRIAGKRRRRPAASRQHPSRPRTGRRSVARRRPYRRPAAVPAGTGGRTRAD